jgi:ABC-type bacteriocin/lantibiotic exporter with double-glycine peptidase domain/CRP-like cAMP-binding protein
VSLNETDRQVLGRVPLLSTVSPQLSDLVVRLFQVREYDFGESLVVEGDAPDGMYVLSEGSARVVVDHMGTQMTLARLQPGDWFGESALLNETTRNATVRASEKTRALFLDAVVFAALLASEPGVREAVLAQTRAHQLDRLLRKHAAFEDLSAQDAARIEPRLRAEDVAAGTEVVHQGDPGERLFIVESGRLEAVRSDNGTEARIGFLSTGDLFGERSLVTGEPCVATVRALTDSRLWSLGHADFTWLSEEVPVFGGRLREIAEGRDYRATARLPLDFAHEILPGGLRGEAQPLPQAAGDHSPDAPDAASLRALMTEAQAQARRKRGRRRRQFPIVNQIDETDCGVACLAMVAKWHGIEVPISSLRDAIGTTVSGASLRAIATAGGHIGLEVQPMKVSRDRLSDLVLPAIIHWRGDHWVVLVRANEAEAELADPAVGRRVVSRDELSQHWDGFAAIVTPTGEPPDVGSGGPNLHWLRPFVAAHRGAIGLALVLALAAAACEVALPLVVESIVNDLVTPHAESVLYDSGLIMLALVVGGTLAVLLQRLALVGATAKFDIGTLDFMTERLLALPMSYFAARRTGDIERRLAGVRQIRRIVVQQGIAALTAATQVIVGLAIMFVLSPVLAALFLVVMPLYGLVMRYSSRRLRPLYAAVEESYGRYASDQVDLLKGIETVKTSATESALRRRLRRVFEDFTVRTAASQRTIARYGSVVQVISLLTYSSFIFLGSIEVHDHRLSLGAFVAFTTLVMLTTGPLVGLLSIWDDVQVSAVLLNRVADVLEHEPEQGEDHGRLLPVPTLEGRVQLVDLTYQPPNTDEPVLAHLNLDIAPGTTVAIVGRSGSGKSTLLRLLAGLVEPTSGRVLFDRVDSTLLSYTELRRKVGFVLQQPYVFAATIADNIGLGDDPPDMDAVRDAARAADLAELVEQLPLGYDTLVGDRGLPLSGGQAQRLTIARALYRRPPLLLFDEATSALDTESEAIVKRNIDRLMENRTAFVVAHRLSTVRNADLIVVLEAGHLAEKGTHEELVERRGIYYYLYSQQALGL